MSVTIKFNEIDAQKMDFLRKRLGYKKNVELLRYLMTTETERVLTEPGVKHQIIRALEREYMEEQNKEKQKMTVPNVLSAIT